MRTNVRIFALADKGGAKMPFDYDKYNQTYSDEPINIPAELQKNFTPPEYRRMRQLDIESPFSFNSDAKVFYFQAKFMERFEDSFEYNHPVNCFRPSYRSLNTSELRAYFTWRTKLRHGIVERASKTFVYIYLYELIHLIGSKTKEEGYQKLVSFSDTYQELDPSIIRRTRQWIIDFAIYYNIDCEMLKKDIDTTFDDAILALYRCDEVDNDTLFNSIMRLSAYELTKSRVYKQQPQGIKTVLCSAYRRLNHHQLTTQNQLYVQQLYGCRSTTSYIPFASALFFDRQKRLSYTYTLSPVQTYRFEHDKWTAERFYISRSQSKALGVLVRTVDRLLRDKYSLKPRLNQGVESSLMLSIVTDAVRELEEIEKKQKEASRPKLRLDLSLLNDIRKNSEITGEKLLTEEERFVEPPDISSSPPAPAEPDSKVEYDGVLNTNELRFVQLLLSGKSTADFLSEAHLMPSILADQINEKLFDEFADTVIEFDGDTPCIVEDYIEDLKGMIPT